MYIKLFWVEAAAKFDPADFIWRRYKGSRKKTFKGKHKTHDVVLEPNDIYGVKQTRSRTPSFQIRLLKEMNILYRNFTQREIENLDKSSRDYRGKIIVEELPEGRQRHNRKTTKPVEGQANRNKDSWFRPRRVPKETLVIDKEYYQWRKMKTNAKNINITAKKSGKVIGKLGPNDVFGLRFVKPSFGGYILFADGQRRHISSATYEQLIDNAKILPTRYQKTGLFEVKEVKDAVKQEKKQEKRVPKNPRNELIKIDINQNTDEIPEEKPIKRKYDIDGDEDILEQVRKTQNSVKSVRRQLKKNAPEIFEQEEEFEPEEELLEEELLEEELPEEEDLDSEELDEEELPEEDFEDEEGEDDFDESWLGEDEEEAFEDEEGEEDFEDEEPSENDEDNELPLSDALTPGDVIRFDQAPKKDFMFVSYSPLERNPQVLEFFFHDVQKDDESVMYRVRVNVNYTLGQFKDDGAKIIDTEEDDERINQLVSALDFAEIKNVSMFKT